MHSYPRRWHPIDRTCAPGILLRRLHAMLMLAALSLTCRSFSRSAAAQPWVDETVMNSILRFGLDEKAGYSAPGPEGVESSRIKASALSVCRPSLGTWGHRLETFTSTFRGSSHLAGRFGR